MKVSVIVLSWNQRDATLACLASLQKADLQGAEVLLVDNGSRDGTAEAARARFPAVGVLALDQNRGYAGGNNAGMRAALDAGADLVLLLNNDTTVSPDFLLPLRWALDGTPGAAAVCSAIHRADRPEMIDVAYSEVRFAEREAVKIRGVNALPGDGFGQRCAIEVAIGCSLLIRAAALRGVGLFDESYFAYHEDVDWCLRARRAGWTLLYEPFSRVFHRGSASTRALHAPPADGEERVDADLPNAEPMPFNPVRAYLGARNLVRLLRAHASRRERLGFVRSCLYEIPLEYWAVVFEREGWMRLGRWHYRDVAGALAAAPAALPERLRAAHRSRRMAQFRAYLRGLLDGALDRPLPLERLGLR